MARAARRAPALRLAQAHRPAAGTGPGSARQARCAATHRSTALARFCHRWNRSADLHRVRCPGAGPVGVGAGAVPADDLDAGMGGQPVRERLGVAAFQQVQRRAGLAVDDDRAVVLAAPDGEVVHPEDPRGGRRRVRGGHDEPEQHLPARRHSHGQGPMPSRTGRLTRRPQGSRTPDRTCTVTACRSCLTSRRTRRSWNTCGSRPARLADLMTTPWAPGSCAATRT